MKKLRFILATAALAAAGSAAALTPPRIAGCPVFNAKNVWNTPVDTLRVHASSAAWVNAIGANTFAHPDFGTFYLGAPIGIPFTTVPGNQARVPVAFDEPGESDAGPYPIPASAPIEGGPASSDDRHVLVLDRDNCVLYEMDAAYPQNGGTSWTAFSGAVWDLKANNNRADTYTSADAAGLPILPGLIRYDEFVAGEINHAIRFTAPQTRNAHVWPATHDAGVANTQLPPMGARFRLKATFDETSYAPQIRVVLRALKKYGMILADNGSPWYLSGEHNPGWDDNLLGQLKNLKGSDFEAVDTAPMEIAANSTAAFRPPPAIAFAPVASGLTQPIYITSAHDGSNRMFILEKTGAIKLLKNGAVTMFMDLSARVLSQSEQGVLNIAFHPQFATNRKFYVAYTPAGSNGDLRVSMFTANAQNPDLGDPASEQAIIQVNHQANTNHYGGQIHFGPDGYLWISTGDGGGGGDVPNNAQNLGVGLGKLLRINVDAADAVRGTPYSIPADNPFVNTGGALPEIWAYGLRNPWRFGFDRLTGDLYIGDVGQNDIEEVDFVPGGAPGGLNFGWHVFEGLQCYPPDTTGCSLPNHYTPVLAYAHLDPAGGSCIIGGYVYRGLKIPALQGYYLFADYISNRLWAATHEGLPWTKFVLSEPPNTMVNVVSFGEDDAGELYLVNSDGTIVTITGPAATADTPPALAIQSRRKVDFNADSLHDIALNHRSGASAQWLMAGGTILAGGVLAGPPGAKIRLLADFDGDGRTDILWRHADGAYSISLMNGITIRSTTRILDPSVWEVVAAADFNGDGRADLLWRSNANAYGAWIMNGASATAFGAYSPPGAGWEAWAVADFNGDGKADVLWRRSDGSVSVTLVNGVTAGPPLALQGPLAGFVPTVLGDFNGDGRTDLVWQHSDGRARVGLMNGGTVLGSQDFALGRSGWVVALAADLDGDGKSDLVWANPNQTFGAWLMNGVTPLGSTGLLATPYTGWSIVGIADLNGDGKSDLLWQKDTGEFAAWFMNGLAPFAYQMYLGPGTGWQMAP